MGDKEVEKAKALVVVQIIEYVPNAVLSRTILKKLTGNVTAISLDIGEGFSEKTSPFDTFIQIIDGRAEIIIDKVSKILETGEGIIVPANKSNSINANERFKMLSTVIKSGYEE